MIRVLVVDDEAPARARLVRMLSAFEGLEVAGEASNGLEALQAAQDLGPDLVFLDIEMPELNGLETARAWAAGGPQVVFVTAYSEHALRAFEVSAADYLVKPVSPERLAETVERIRRRRPASLEEMARLYDRLEEGQMKRRMAVKVGSKYRVFDPAQISAVVARDHYAALLVEGQELLVDDSLESLSGRLDGRKFLRIHRGALINLDYLRELEHEGDRKYLAVLSDAARTKLPVSRDRLDELKKKLGMD